MKRWYPLRSHSQPVKSVTPGALVAWDHAVWRVAHTSFEDGDVRLELQHLGGKPPERTPTRVGAPAEQAWIPVYRDGRWPACSCCGEPMPCRTEMMDEEIAEAADRLAVLNRKVPGVCWGCEQPITTRQQFVAYPGPNLDLPGGPDVVFHARMLCRGAAAVYEERWLAEDPRRERILTYAKCGGLLVVHADGMTECFGGGGEWWFPRRDIAPDCRGHLTHDHVGMAACSSVGDGFVCGRGCGVGHGIEVASRRPLKRG